MVIIMKKKIVIFGTTDFAYQIYRYIKQDNENEVVAFTANKEFCSSSTFLDLPVIPIEELSDFISMENCCIIIAIGYNSMNNIRNKVYKQVKELGFQVGSYIHKSAVVLSDNIGEGNIILEGTIIGLGCKIGKCNVFMSGTCISHDCVIGDFNFFAPSATVAGKVLIENKCFIGANSTIKNELSIADYSLIGAGAYLNFSTKRKQVIVPSRSMSLDKESLELTI